MATKYSKALDDELVMQINDILSHAEEGMTLMDIGISIGVNGLTTQKIARLIKKVDEFSPVIREKNSQNLLKYKLYAVHKRQGYDMAKYDKPADPPKKESTYFNPGTTGWIAPRYRRFHLDEE